MPSTYNPDPTATQAPAATPDPTNYPDESLPADGDALDAASVAQAFKAPADYVAWLKKPRAKVSSWAQAVRRYMNARLHTGNVFNHQGILDGRVLLIQEDWIDVGGVTKGIAPASGAWFGRWNFGIFGQGGNVFASPPATSLNNAPWGPRAGVTIIGGLSPFAQTGVLIEMCRGFMLGGSAFISMEVALSVNPNGAGTLDTADTFSLGFSSGTLVAAAETGPCNTGAMASNAGAFLVKQTGGSDWAVVSRPVGGGGSSTAPVATVAADTPLRYRVEAMTAAASDDNTARVIHYVNGVVAANHTVDMAGAMLTPFFRTSGQYSGPQVHSVLNVGRPSFAGRLELGDIYP